MQSRSKCQAFLFIVVLALLCQGLYRLMSSVLILICLFIERVKFDSMLTLNLLTTTFLIMRF